MYKADASEQPQVPREYGGSALSLPLGFRGAAAGFSGSRLGRRQTAQLLLLHAPGSLPTAQ